MKIAMVCASDARGGLEKHVADLSAGMADRGHDVTVIAPAGMATQLAPSVSFKVVNLKRSRWSPWLQRDLKAALAGEWDVVHAHANKAASLVASVKSTVDAKRWVATLHNQKSNLSMYAPYDHVIVVSSALKAGVPNENVSVVLNGIDVKAPSTTRDRQWLAGESDLSVEEPILLAVGRLVPAKGFDLLIAAAAKAGVQVVIAGDGPEKKRLESLRKKHSLSRVALLGYRSDVPELLSACDGFVISSRNEGGPYTLAEALLARKPVLATRVGMVPDVLPDELVMSTSIESMAGFLLAWSNNMNQWIKASVDTFELAGHILNRQTMLSAIEAAYKDSIK